VVSGLLRQPHLPQQRVETPLGAQRRETRMHDAARRLGISLNRLNEIVLGKRGVTADTALRLTRLFKMSPQFWMRLQPGSASGDRAAGPESVVITK
jgi:addiction module HigA family antidote